MFGRPTTRLATLWLAASSVACTFGGDGGMPEPLGLGEQPQVDGEAPPLDEPLDPLDGDGGGQGDGAGAAGDGDDGSADAGDDGSAGESGGDSADDGTDDGADAGADDGAPGMDAGDDGVDVDCNVPFSEIFWAEDAMVTEPMVLATAPSAAQELFIAYSPVAEEGTVAFEVELPCAGEYVVHGLVWDLAPGAWANPDADSLYIDVGDGEEFVWRYGCQTLGLFTALSWQPLTQLLAQPCNAAGVSVIVPEPGTYTLTVRNRESGNQSAVAAVAAVSMSTDLGYDPYADYDPYAG